MTIQAVGADGKFTAEFAAYTNLVVVNRLKQTLRGNEAEKNNSMTFQQFMDAVRKEEGVHQSNSRAVSKEELADNQVYETQNGLSAFVSQRFATIQKAYELGLVDQYGVLLSN
ncbi:hypothetical protein NST99_31785 [Paenibacillus sp. FSL L8-0470]|uniref:hypothetical protein n=1 Tax=unclassified Paenibacillus TaxID=185978 RepID=UPI0030F4C2A6